MNNYRQYFLGLVVLGVAFLLVYVSVKVAQPDPPSLSESVPLPVPRPEGAQ